MNGIGDGLLTMFGIAALGFSGLHTLVWLLGKVYRSIYREMYECEKVRASYRELSQLERDFANVKKEG